jgi:hypothetical protein
MATYLIIPFNHFVIVTIVFAFGRNSSDSLCNYGTIPHQMKLSICHCLIPGGLLGLVLSFLQVWWKLWFAFLLIPWFCILSNLPAIRLTACRNAILCLFLVMPCLHTGKTLTMSILIWFPFLYPQLKLLDISMACYQINDLQSLNSLVGKLVINKFV